MITVTFFIYMFYLLINIFNNIVSFQSLSL